MNVEEVKKGLELIVNSPSYNYNEITICSNAVDLIQQQQARIEHLEADLLVKENDKKLLGEMIKKLENDVSFFKSTLTGKENDVGKLEAQNQQLTQLASDYKYKYECERQVVVDREMEIKQLKDRLGALPSEEEMVEIMAQFGDDILYSNAQYGGYKKVAKAISNRINQEVER